MRRIEEPVSGGPARDAGNGSVMGTRGVVSVGLGEQGPERLHLVRTRDPQRQRLPEPERRKGVQISVCFFFFFLNWGEGWKMCHSPVSFTCCVQKDVST